MTKEAFKAESITLYDDTDGTIALTVADRDMTVTLSLPLKLAKRMKKLLQKKSSTPLQFNGSTSIFFSKPLKKDIINNLDDIIVEVNGLTY